jgi:thioredoxin 1
LLPILVLAGCDGITIGTPETPDCTPVLPPQPEPQANVEVLAFTASWCGPCRRDKPQIEEMRRRGVKVTEIDIDEDPQLARQYKVRQVPTYVVLEDGVEIQRTSDICDLVKFLVAILKIAIPIILILL